MEQEGSQVKNKPRETQVPALWLLPAPGSYLQALGYVDYIPPSGARQVLMQITC